MNPLISLLITLTCEVALVVGVGFVAERLLHSVRDRRRLWCAVLIGVGLLAAVELAGLRVEVRRWASLGLLGTPRPSEPRWVVTGGIGAVRRMVIEPSYSAQEASTPTDLPAPLAVDPSDVGALASRDDRHLGSLGIPAPAIAAVGASESPC